MSTHRQRLIELLSAGTFSLLDLSSELHLSTRELLDHLKHVRKSVRPPRRFIMEPPECLNCGFVFKDRNRLHSPGKCPRCRGTHIREPVFKII